MPSLRLPHLESESIRALARRLVEQGSRFREKDGTRECTFQDKGKRGWWKVQWDGDDRWTSARPSSLDAVATEPPQPFSPFKHVEVGSRLRKKDGTKEGTLMGKGTKGWWKILWDGDDQTVNTRPSTVALANGAARGPRAPPRPAASAPRVDDSPGAAIAEDEEQPALRFAAGDRVEARWKGGSRYYSGTVLSAAPSRTSRRGPTYAVKYDDGDVESHVPEALVRRGPRGASPAEADEPQLACPVCLEDLGDATALECGHHMHAACLRQYAASRWFEVKATSARRSPRKPTISCPICRKVTRERADDEDALPGLTRERKRKRPRVATA